MNEHIFEVSLLAIQILMGFGLGYVVPWAMKVSNRLTRLETLITNGLSSDVKHIKDNCPGCQILLLELNRRVKALDPADG